MPVSQPSEPDAVLTDVFGRFKNSDADDQVKKNYSCGEGIIFIQTPEMKKAGEGVEVDCAKRVVRVISFH